MSIWSDIIEGFRAEPADPLLLQLADAQRVNAILENQQLLMEERLAEIEVELEADGWQRLDGYDGRELSRRGLATMVRLSRSMYVANPLIRKGVNDGANYVFGQGYTIVARNSVVNDVVQACWDDKDNRAELTSDTQGHAQDVELTTTGNYFLALKQTPLGRVKMRSIPIEEVDDVLTNPEDRRDPWFYKRVWTPTELDPATGLLRSATPQVRWYADWQAQPPGGIPSSIGAAPVDPDWKIRHVRVGPQGHRFGVPDCYAALAWARAAQQDLQAMATIHQALARFVYTLKVPGNTTGQVAAAKAKLQSGIGSANGETNPAPAVGSTFVAAEGASLTAMNNSGARPDPEGWRPFRLMAAAGLGVPETFLGDADVGNHATAETLDRPTELKFVTRQKLWKEVFEDIANYQIDADAMSAGGWLAGREERDLHGESHIVVFDPNDPEGSDEPVDRKLDVVFPSILERDPNARVNAVVSAATLDGKAPAGTMTPKMMARLLLDALAVDDIDEELRTLFPPEEELPPTPEEEQEQEERLVTAITELRAALVQVIETAS